MVANMAMLVIKRFITISISSSWFSSGRLYLFRILNYFCHDFRKQAVTPLCNL